MGGFAGNGHVARDDVEQQGHIRRALDVVLAPQGVDAAAGHPHVAQQLLHNGVAADDLHPGGMLGAPHGVHEAGGLTGLAGGAVGGRHLQEDLLGHPGGNRHHLRGITGVEGLHELEDAAGVAQGRVGDGLAVRAGFIIPGGGVVGVFLFVVPGKQAVVKAEVFINHEGGIGIIDHVVFMKQVVGQDVIDQAAHQGDVGAGPQAHVKVGPGGGPGEAGVHHNEFGPLFHGLGDPFEADGMVFGGIAADDHDAIGVGDVVPVVGHGTPAEGGPQRGHRGGVSEAGLVFQIDDAQGPG